MDEERPFPDWLRDRRSLPAAAGLALLAWLVARLARPLGDAPVGSILLLVAALGIAVPVLHVRRTGGAERAGWVVALIAGGHVALFALSLLTHMEGCPSGPLPWFVGYVFAVYMSATRVVPFLLLGVGGLGMLVPRRTRWAGAWCLLAVLLYVLITAIVYYEGPGCGLEE